MEWIIFNNSSDDYKEFADDHQSSGIWHYPCWLEFQLSCKKAADGFIFGIKDSDEIILAGIYLVYRSSAKINYGYIPAGFLYKRINNEIYDFFIKNLEKTVASRKVVYTGIDSIIPYNEEFYRIIQNYKNHSLKNIKLPIPQHSTVIDLSKSEDEILNCMKPKGRYNIKLAGKKGVTIKQGSHEDIKIFYDILKVTANRDDFKTNSLDYYSRMLESIPQAKLLVASYENEMLSGGIFTYTGRQALYYYGASSNNMRNLMAPYLMQWEAIAIAKKSGCAYFDFMGISDPEKPDDRLTSVTEFKLKFGGDIVKFNPSYIIIHNKPVYSLINFLKKIIR